MKKLSRKAFSQNSPMLLNVHLSFLFKIYFVLLLYVSIGLVISKSLPRLRWNNKRVIFFNQEALFVISGTTAMAGEIEIERVIVDFGFGNIANLRSDKQVSPHLSFLFFFSIEIIFCGGVCGLPIDLYILYGYMLHIPFFLNQTQIILQFYLKNKKSFNEKL